MRIVLASGSPRRRELLEQIGLKFEVAVSDAQEEGVWESPKEMVEELSRRKAEAVLGALPEKEATLVIGADTVVARKGRVMGKPGDRKEAVKMLKKLSGRSHKVYTGVTLLYRTEDGEGAEKVCRKTFHEMTKVRFYPLSAKEIRDYVETGDPMDKAGAYGIQGVFARYVERMEGDYNNVVGLPVGRLYQEAKEWLERESRGRCE